LLPPSPLLYHQGWIALGFSLQIGCTPLQINLAQSSVVFKLTCSQVHYICTINTGVPILTKFWQHNPLVASLLLRSCGPKPPLASDHSRDVEFSKIRTLLPRSSCSHCSGQHTSGCPFCAHVSLISVFEVAEENTTSMFVTLLSPSSGHSWLSYGLIRNRKHKSLPNQIIISVLLRTIHYS
jgi:hypothetical protein